MSAASSIPAPTLVSPALRWLTRILCWLCWAGIALTVGGGAAATFGLLPESMISYGGSGNSVALIGSEITIDDPSNPGALAGLLRDPVYLLARLVPAALIVWALLSARASFASLGRGEWFARSTIGGLRNLAIATLLYMTAAPIVLALGQIPYLASFEHGSFMITVNLNAGVLLILIFAGAVAVVSTVMSHAAKIAEENEQFV